MEKKALIAEIEKLALKAGIKQSKLDRNIQLSFLPEEGEFSDYKIMSEKTTFAHIRMITTSGHGTSVSSIQALGYKGTIEEAKSHLREKAKNETTGFPGGWVLGGTTAVNPHLSGKMAVVVADLIGRKFTTKVEQRIVLPIKTKTDADGEITILGYTTQEEAAKALTVKDFFHITLLPETAK